MKKFFLILWLGVIFFSTILYFFNSNEFVNSEENIMPYQNSDSNINYVVKNYRGNVAVFENGKDDPLRITDISLNELPLDDIELLNKGIFVKNAQELNIILEDYLA